MLVVSICKAGQYVAAPAELIEEEETRLVAMEIVRPLIDRIEVGPPEAER